jgi:hypothetical protein
MQPIVQSVVLKTVQIGCKSNNALSVIRQPHSRLQIYVYTMPSGCRLDAINDDDYDVGGGKNSTYLILATEHSTGHQTVNMFKLYNRLHQLGLTNTVVQPVALR